MKTAGHANPVECRAVSARMSKATSRRRVQHVGGDLSVRENEGMTVAPQRALRAAGLPIALFIAIADSGWFSS